MALPNLRIAIVIPAFDAEHFLPKTLPAALESGADEVVVVDAGSGDETGAVAARLGASVIRLKERAGPARARNFGASQVDTDLILFIDSDCRIDPGVLSRVREAFASDGELVALSGSYDCDSPAPGFFSSYMNLRHHFTHQVACKEGASFWSGCGAVRRDAFLRTGGFDSERFPRPQIEDIELGLRLATQGKCRLEPTLHVAHFKHWTFASVVKTDIFDRAIPWTRLILEQGVIPNDLNLRHSQRAAAALAPFALLSALLAPLAAVTGRVAWLAVALTCLAGSLMLNRGLFQLFSKQRGLLFGAKAWLFHQLHLIYSALAFGFCLFENQLRPSKSRAGEALSPNRPSSLGGGLRDGHDESRDPT